MKKKTFIILLISFGVLLGGAAAGYRFLSSGYDLQGFGGNADSNAEQVPDFTVLNQAGQGVSLSSKFGKPLVVNFWATWCGPCKSELPAFDAAYNSHEEVEFLMVNLTDGQRETKKTVKSFLATNEYTFPVYYDTLSSAATAYNIYGVPATYFIRSDGTLQNSVVGAISAEQLEEYIDALLAEE